MRRTMDMTSGPVLGKILLFSIPLMASNVLQILFNSMDIVVVGRYAGYNSLAAVGSTSSIVNLFTNLLIRPPSHSQQHLVRKNSLPPDKKRGQNHMTSGSFREQVSLKRCVIYRPDFSEAGFASCLIHDDKARYE